MLILLVTAMSVGYSVAGLVWNSQACQQCVLWHKSVQCFMAMWQNVDCRKRLSITLKFILMIEIFNILSLFVVISFRINNGCSCYQQLSTDFIAAGVDRFSPSECHKICNLLLLFNCVNCTLRVYQCWSDCKALLGITSRVSLILQYWLPSPPQNWSEILWMWHLSHMPTVPPGGMLQFIHSSL